MNTTPESGNARNIENFGLLLEALQNLGNLYNPVNPDLQLLQLQAKKQRCETVSVQFRDAVSLSKQAVSARNEQYGKMDTLVIRIYASMQACGTETGIMDNLKGIKNKLLGRRSSKIKEGTPPEKTRSASQTGLENRKANFEALVSLLRTQPQYAPNELEISTSRMEAYLTDLHSVFRNAQAAQEAMQLAMVTRDKELYAEGTGLADTAKSVKAYLKSMMGTNDPHYKHIISIKIEMKKI